MWDFVAPARSRLCVLPFIPQGHRERAFEIVLNAMEEIASLLSQ